MTISECSLFRNQCTYNEHSISITLAKKDMSDLDFLYSNWNKVSDFSRASYSNFVPGPPILLFRFGFRVLPKYNRKSDLDSLMKSLASHVSCDLEKRRNSLMLLLRRVSRTA